MPVDPKSQSGVPPPPYWVTLSGRGNAQIIEIYSDKVSPTPGTPYLSWSVHGPYPSLAAAAAYSKSLGGNITPLMSAQGKQLGTVNVTAKDPEFTSGADTKTAQNNSSEFESKRVRAAGGTVGDIPNPVSWLESLGGMIASGIEAGFVALLKDLWGVIIGPLEILAGAVLGIIILVFAFKEDLAPIAGMIARGALI